MRPADGAVEPELADRSLVEGPLAPLPCASETQFRRCDECVDVETCGTAIVMRQVRDAIAQILEDTTLAAVCAKVDRAVQKKRSRRLSRKRDSKVTPVATPSA